MAAPLAAHHGRRASFDMKKQVTLKGTVSQVKWQNPHVLICAPMNEVDTYNKLFRDPTSKGGGKK